MTVLAFVRSASKRSMSALNFAISLSRGSAFGRPAGPASVCRAPLSRRCRHVVIIDEYSPSHRSRAPERPVRAPKNAESALHVPQDGKQTRHAGDPLASRFGVHAL